MHNEKDLQNEAVKLLKESLDFKNNITNGNDLNALVNILKTNIESLNYSDQERNYIIMYAFAYAIIYTIGGNNASI